MASNEQKNPYHTAYDEAFSELRSIFGELEQLNAQRNRVETLMKALAPAIASGDAAWKPRQRRTSLPGLTVVTRISPSKGTQEAGN